MENVGSYCEMLRTLLNDRRKAAEYLSEAASTGNTEVFYDAIRDVMEAQVGGVEKMAAMMKVKEEVLSQILSKETNPNLTGLDVILEVLGLEIAIVEKKTYGTRYC